ncbi:substrate-binding periplasmic protein [Aquipseudomonas guryensis]|uniref:Transporter substrate-binding domain-containing protein n=1 Tax=Aquipseudomonas guryensis TaxID=2759165 RepID=A0A7W4H574_9GAMM|nr:transporter substrate-binding domain-containing protein [Pseudomonas guryensis]MBB1521438.1 transporter substrate-binding domain-containing protein [Pseudomonas guryensis]
MLSLGVLLVTPTTQAAGESLRVGYFDLPPHTRTEGAQPSGGISVAYFELIARKMDLRGVSYSRLPLPRLLKMLERGELDMILLLAKDAERDARFLYPQQALFSTASVLAVQASNPLAAIHSAEDLLALRIGIWQDGYRSPLMRDPRLQLQTLSGDNVMNKGLRMVAAGRVDAFYFPDDFTLKYEAKNLGNQVQIKVLTMPEQPLRVYSVFSRKNGNQYLPRYERALREVQAQQPYAEFFDAFNED